MVSTARDIMTQGAECVGETQTLVDAARKMRDLDVGALPVCGDDDRLKGIVTDRDIVIQAVAEEKDTRGMPVREVASREVVTIGPEEDLSEALKLMASYQVRRIPVVDEDNRLVGIVAQADVAREVKEKDSGQLLQEISQTPTGPRV